jgi:hypothetical protein
VEEKKSKELYPCEKEDCRFYKEYMFRNYPEWIMEYTQLPLPLVYCLFCIEFKRQDMYCGRKRTG